MSDEHPWLREGDLVLRPLPEGADVPPGFTESRDGLGQRLAYRLVRCVSDPPLCECGHGPAVHFDGRYCVDVR